MKEYTILLRPDEMSPPNELPFFGMCEESVNRIYDAICKLNPTYYVELREHTHNDPYFKTLKMRDGIWVKNRTLDLWAIVAYSCYGNSEVVYTGYSSNLDRLTLRCIQAFKEPDIEDVRLLLMDKYEYLEFRRFVRNHGDIIEMDE